MPKSSDERSHVNDPANAEREIRPVPKPSDRPAQPGGHTPFGGRWCPRCGAMIVMRADHMYRVSHGVDARRCRGGAIDREYPKG